MKVLDRLAAQRLAVFVGPGGVGKTTLAAALGVEAARRGKRVLCLTIDPAKRLASALGLDGLDDAIRRVDLSSIEPVDSAGSLHAAMLDTRASYDALIARISPDEETRARIIDNRVYRAFSRTLARSHAYVAMERLYDVMHRGEWDLVILDTPPLRSALDILDAPTRLSRFLDDRVVRWFLGKVPDASEPDGASGRGAGSAAALRILGAIASRELVEEMMMFFRLFASMRRGFSERADAVSELLRRPDTSFVLVGAADSSHFDDALFMCDGLVARGLAPDLVVLNRSYPPEPGYDARPVASVDEDAARRADRLYPNGAPPKIRAVLDALGALRADQARRAETALLRADELASGLPSKTTKVVLPELGAEVISVVDLSRLATLLERRGT